MLLHEIQGEQFYLQAAFFSKYTSPGYTARPSKSLGTHGKYYTMTLLKSSPKSSAQLESRCSQSYHPI